MQQQPDDGGPAFPIYWEDMSMGTKVRHELNGMSLRDYFAAAALNYITPFGTVKEVVSLSYGIADAMLKKRLQPKKEK